MVKSVLIIRSGTDLDYLLDNRVRYSCIELRSGILSESDRKKHEARLTKYYLSCGCNVGGFSMIAIMLFLLPYVYLKHRSGEILAMEAVATVFLVMMLALVVGKVAGLGLATLRLKKEITRLRAILAKEV